MFDGAREHGDDEAPASLWPWRALLAAVALLGLISLAFAQSGAPSDCSGTAGTQSTAIVFPASGQHGPPRPTLYLSVVNSAGTNKLALNTNGAAAIDSSGSLPMDSLGSGWTWSAAGGYPPPATINIIASSSSTPFSCKYQ